MAAPAVTRERARAARPRRRLGRGALYVLLVMGAAWFVAPLLWMVTSSLKTPLDINHYPPVLLPVPAHWGNYAELMRVWPFWLYLRNTLIITVPSVAGQILSSSIVAYGFSRVRWPGRNIVFLVVLATLMLPFQVTMVPLFVVFRQLGLVGTYAPLILPNFFASAFNVFLFRQFFLGIPRDLTDAARIDGAGHFRIYWRIVMPLAKPALATVALFEFLYNWNDFLGPLIYLQENGQYTLSLALQDFQSRSSPEPHLLMAASTLIILPVLAVFLVAQRAFVRGITMTGTTG